MFRKTILAAAALLATFLPVPAFSANLAIKDGNSVAQTLCALTMGDSSLAECNVLVDTTATKIDPATKQLQETGNASLATIATGANASVFYNGATGSGSALAGSATFTGATRDSGIAAGAQHGISYFNSFFLADQAGTARIDCSNDGSTWYTCATAAMTAGTPLILSVPVMTRYHRAVVVNGSSAETYLWVNSSYTGA